MAPGPGHRRVRLAIGPGGRDAYEPTVTRITDAWRTTYSPETISQLTDAATALASDLPAGIPDYPPGT